PALEIFCDELLAAHGTPELLLGLYDKALPALQQALQQHLLDTNPLADHPTLRVLRFALMELAEMLEYGQQCLASLVSEESRNASAPWLQRLDACLDAAGKLDG